MSIFAPRDRAPRLAGELPHAARAWVRAALPASARLVAVVPMTIGSTTMHALEVAVGNERRHLVLRRFHDAVRIATDPWYQPSHEAEVLTALSGHDIPAPRLVALDPLGSDCGSPALLATLLPGSPVPPPRVPADFVGSLARTLAAIHDVSPISALPLPAYARYHDAESEGPWRPPPWTRRAALWERVFEIIASPPPTTPTGFIHRDYHPAQALFVGDTLTGVCDWLTACAGPYGIDLARMRLNLAEGWGLELADAFESAYRRSSGEDRAHPYWDLLDAADAASFLPPYAPDEALAGHARFEAWVARAAAALGAS